MPHRLSSQPLKSRHLAVLCSAALATVALLSGCGDKTVASRAAFPMAEIPRFDQPPPGKPLLGAPIVTAKQILPPAKADIREPLPAAVPLPAGASGVHDSPAVTNSDNAGGVNPAAGQAAAITDGQGEGSKYAPGAPK